jgi:hypothetical protein
LIERARKIKVISQSDQERLEIELLIRRHETALLRALKRFHRRYPKDAGTITDVVSHNILLTKENG